MLGLVEYLAALEPSVRPKGLLIHEAAGVWVCSSAARLLGFGHPSADGPQ